MYSLNAPVPAGVSRIAQDLRAELLGFEAVRDNQTMVIKRLGNPTEGFHAMENRLREALAGTAPMEARVAEIGVFEEPPNGSAPVVYLNVESPGLKALHERMVAEFGAVPDLEGEEYVIHVTLARGGDRETADRLRGRAVGPYEWTVSELHVYDATYDQPAARITLPA